MYEWEDRYGPLPAAIWAATFATVIALGVMKALIDGCGMMTTLAVFVEVAVSFLVNFFVRKFFIFKG